MLRAMTLVVSMTLAAGPSAAWAEAPSPEDVAFFEKRVRPVLAHHCVSCHGAKKQMSGLRLDSRSAAFAGGDGGAVIEPGKPDDSALIEAVRYAAGGLQMPPAGKLDAAAIADLAEWVRRGAVWPADEPARGAADDSWKTHWAFQPIRKPAPPAVRDPSWVRDPIDAFILAKLEAEGWRPSPPADRRTLLRRVNFDLVGLPPTWEETVAFENDSAPDAYERIVDRLLASPQYGERWGRHWLDVARYADTKGYVLFEDAKYPWAYAYRDYVVDAFHRDLPFDRFLLEQLAADLLPLGEDRRALAAMGFLTVGNHFMSNKHDVIDDRIDVVCRGLIGLTVGCARCHDHKYDPIPTQDYYSLYGVFAGSIEPTTPPLFAPAPTTPEYAKFAGELDAREKKLHEFIAGKHAGVIAQARTRVADFLLAAYAQRGQPTANDFMLLADGADLNPTMVNRWRTYLERTQKTKQPAFVVWHALAAIPEENFAAEAPAVMDRLHAASATVNSWTLSAFEAPPESMAEVAKAYADLLTEVECRASALGATGSTSVAGFPDPGLEELWRVLHGPDSPADWPISDANSLELLPDRASQAEHTKLQNAVQQWLTSGPGAPARAMTLEELPRQAEPRVFVRGNPANLGEPAPRRFLEALAGPERRTFEKGSGRLELAQAIAHRDNPLTARVIVNRVWQWRFGAGLVATPSDFGMRSDPPSHPELLDWLAATFVEDGWSLKKLHRRMVLSNVYRQSSADRPEMRDRDPENRLLGRMNRQRLDFESMRDALLAATGDWDRQVGGPAVDLFAEPFPRRRTLYGFMDRHNLPGVFRTFNFPTPDATCPKRDDATVPPQALYWLNNGFVRDVAHRVLDRPDVAGLDDPAKRVERIFEVLYARRPTTDECRWSLEFLRPEPTAAPANAWSYGFGAIDPARGATISFERLPYWTGVRWQGGPSRPDGRLGWLTLDARGGHPSTNPRAAVIRRWTAPFTGEATIAGSLRHENVAGDGVSGRILSSRTGEIGFWTARNQTVETSIGRRRVEKGETIDFAVDAFGTESYDEFQWSPTIARQDEPGVSDVWDAARDFRGEKIPWTDFAHALLMANEFVTID